MTLLYYMLYIDVKLFYKIIYRSNSLRCNVSQKILKIYCKKIIKSLKNILQVIIFKAAN